MTPAGVDWRVPGAILRTGLKCATGVAKHRGQDDESQQMARLRDNGRIGSQRRFRCEPGGTSRLPAERFDLAGIASGPIRRLPSIKSSASS